MHQNLASHFIYHLRKKTNQVRERPVAGSQVKEKVSAQILQVVVPRVKVPAAQATQIPLIRLNPGKLNKQRD